MFYEAKPYRKFILIPVVLLALLSACKKEKTTTPKPTPAEVIAESEALAIPDAVAIPANASGNTRVQTFYAEGIQKYKSQLKSGNGPTAVYEWVFMEPRADLFNATGNKVGTHTAGPTWQLSQNDSIYAQAFSPARTAPSTIAGSIDWLLLMPKTGTTPTGSFEGVSYIQRIATKGGKAPVRLPQSSNEIANVPYTAVYRFTKKNP